MDWSRKFAYFCEVFPSLMSRWQFSIHAGILNCNGLLMTATTLLTSSVVNSPARLFISMSHFLHTMLEKRRPMPRIAVSAYITFCRPSTFVLHIRRMCWKFCDWNWTDIAAGRALPGRAPRVHGAGGRGRAGAL